MFEGAALGVNLKASKRVLRRFYWDRGKRSALCRDLSRAEIILGAGCQVDGEFKRLGIILRVVLGGYLLTVNIEGAALFLGLVLTQTSEDFEKLFLHFLGDLCQAFIFLAHVIEG